MFQPASAETCVTQPGTPDGVYLLGTVPMNIGNCTVPVDVIGVKHADGEYHIPNASDGKTSHVLTMFSCICRMLCKKIDIAVQILVYGFLSRISVCVRIIEFGQN